MSKDTEKTRWLRMESSEGANRAIRGAIELWLAVNGKTDDGEWIESDALSEICREWADRERERIRRPEK